MTATKVDLNSGEQVQGTLPVANGGTGSTTLAGAGIELTANKNAANGYTGLGAGGFVAPAQLGSGSASSTTFLRGDQTYATPAGGATVDPVTVSSAASLTLVVSSTTAVQDYVYNGSVATTWTLPAVSGNTGKRLILENAGTAAAAVITLNRAGTDNLWFLSALTTIPIARGGSLLLVCDGTYWQVLSTDLANDAVGVLPLANGGTGQTGGDTHITSAAGTTALTVTSTWTQVVTGTTTQTITLPTTSVLAGMQWQVINQSTGLVTVQASAGATVIILAAGTSAVFNANATAPTTAAGWDTQYGGVAVTSGKSLSVSNTLTLAGTDATTMTFPPSSGQVDAEQFCTLTSAYTLASQTAAQKLFNVSTNGAVAVGIGTYFFDCFFIITSMSATSGAFGFAIGQNTATIGGQAWQTEANKSTLNTTPASAQNTVNTGANTTIVTANTGTFGWAHVWGKIRITAAGSIVPQVSLTVAAAAVISTDSYFRIWPVGSSTVTTVGTWS
jgi:fibronectin-binding autotransporter adhesin